MQTRPFLALASACLLLTACASGGSASGDSPLVGKFQNAQRLAIFNTDGTFTGTTSDGKDWVRGTYTVEGNTLTMIDTWEDKAVLAERCEGVPGRYTWKIENDTLIAQLLEDACVGRGKTINGMEWKRVR